MSDQPLVAVVVVNFGSHRLLTDPSFNAIGAEPRVRLLVVDNLHSAAERDAVRDLCVDHGWDLVPLEQNRGFGAGVNAGVERAAVLEADAVVVVNPDARVTAPVVRELARRVVGDEQLLLTPLIERPDGSVWFAGGELDRRTGRTRTRGVDLARARDPWITGACLASSVALWRRIGGFDDRYFMYWEDVDLSHRVRAGGGRVGVAADLRAVHEVGATQGELKSDLYRRFNCRNRLLFAALHLGPRGYRKWLWRAPAYARLVLLRDGRRPLLRRGIPMLWSVVSGTAEGAVLGLLHLRSGRRGPGAVR